MEYNSRSTQFNRYYKKSFRNTGSDVRQTFNPAALISLFSDEEEQRQAAELFNTKLEELQTRQEREKALHDIIYTVKRNSYEYYSGRMGADVDALNQVIAGKKALEELSKTHISLDE